MHVEPKSLPYERFVERMRIGALIVDSVGHVLYCNPFFSELVGRPSEELLGSPLARLVQDRNRLTTLLEQARQAPASAQIRILTPGGPTRVRFSASPIGGQEPDTCGVLITLPDVSRQAEVEAALRASENRYRLLVEQAFEGICLLDSKGEVLDANSSLARILGTQVSDLVGKDVHDLDFLEELGLRGKSLEPEEAAPTERTLEGTIRRPDGTEISVEGTRTRLPNGNLLLIVRDVTERHLVEREILEISQRLERRIGRDLYDILAQQLAGIGFLTKVLEQRLKTRGLQEVYEAKRIGQLVKEAIRQTRDLAHGLCPIDFTADGLNTALQELCRYVAEVLNVSCQFSSSAATSVSDDSSATQLYLIAQEIVTAAVKEGGAKQLSLVLEGSDTRTTLTVEHDGETGLSAGKAGEKSFQIVRHRASLIGAKLSVARREGGWVAIRCRLPRKPPTT